MDCPLILVHQDVELVKDGKIQKVDSTKTSIQEKKELLLKTANIKIATATDANSALYSAQTAEGGGNLHQHGSHQAKENNSNPL